MTVKSIHNMPGHGKITEEKVVMKKFVTGTECTTSLETKKKR